MNHETKRHHPQYPGFWLHPCKGSFELGPEAHHSAFFREQPDLFGADLNAAFEAGWISVRRWVGEQEAWALRYHALESASPTLSSWAAKVIDRWPSEAEVQVLGFPSANEPGLCGLNLAQTRNGKLSLVLEGRRQAVTDWSDEGNHVKAPPSFGWPR